MTNLLPLSVTQVHFAPQGNVASRHTSKHCLMLTLAMSHLRAALASSWHEKKIPNEEQHSGCTQDNQV